MVENSLLDEELELPADVTSKDKRFNPFSLDAINFLLADVRGALGPYLNVFLVTQRHWSQTEVGLVTTLGGLLGLAAQTPIGGMIDATRAKRGVIVLALGVLAIGAVTIFASPTFLILGGAALVALIVFATQMPETVEQTKVPAEKALSQE
jgi:predicted MFS family arabinose efflux permease